jgi:hypothetical protein
MSNKSLSEKVILGFAYGFDPSDPSKPSLAVLVSENGCQLVEDALKSNNLQATRIEVNIPDDMFERLVKRGVTMEWKRKPKSKRPGESSRGRIHRA